MSNVSGVGAHEAIINALNKKEDTDKDDHGRSDFLKLLVAQLNNQNPLEPQASGEFLSQLAQFSTVEGVEKLSSQFNSFASSMLSNQALQATTLVGRSVQVPSSTGRLTQGEALTGSIALPASTSSLSLRVYDQNGTLVRDLPMGSHPSGMVNFSWDGNNNNGTSMASGRYRVEAHAYIDGESEQLKAYVNANVDSVTTEAGGSVLLNLEGGLGSVALNEVLRIN